MPVDRGFSIARWIWRRFTPAGFRAIQRRKGVKGWRGVRGGTASREAIADRDRAIVADRAFGHDPAGDRGGLPDWSEPGGVRLALKRNA